MEPVSPVSIIAACALAIGLLAGCSQRTSTCIVESPQQRYDAAKGLFEKAAREYHIPSAQARGSERTQLEDRALAAYTDLAHAYSDQPIWAAQALRSLGNIHAARTNLAEALRAYGAAAERYSQQDFEVLMAWKSAGDLLSDAGKSDQGKLYYEKLLARFDKPDALPIVQSVVRGAKARLEGKFLSPARDRQ
jgi:tetratricopeptide (TPR) repeat protein